MTREEWRGRTYGVSQEPVDGAGVEDVSCLAGDEAAGAVELDGDGGVAEVGGHGVVGDGGDEHHGDEHVVEDAVAGRGEEGPDDEDDGGEHHDGGDGPEPVGAMGGDVDVGGGDVDVESVVCSCVERRRHAGGGCLATGGVEL